MSRISRIRQKCPVVNLSMHDAHEMASGDLGRLRSATASTFLPTGGSDEFGVAKIRQTARKGTEGGGGSEFGVRRRRRWDALPRNPASWSTKLGSQEVDRLAAALFDNVLLDILRRIARERVPCASGAELQTPNAERRTPNASSLRISERQMLTMNVKLERSMTDHQTLDCCPQTACV
jgi:hypothetical protein